MVAGMMTVDRWTVDSSLSSTCAIECWPEFEVGRYTETEPRVHPLFGQTTAADLLSVDWDSLQAYSAKVAQFDLGFITVVFPKGSRNP